MTQLATLLDSEPSVRASAFPGKSGERSWRRVWWLTLTALLATLPFVRKPLHIDDPADLQYVRQILSDPLDPYGFEFDWGEGPRPAIRNYHPPLKFYYHALVLAPFALAGDPFRSTYIEELLHLSYLPFVLLTVFAVDRLCRYFDVPVWPVLLMWLFGPGYLPGQNAMLDVPALALGLGAAACVATALATKQLRPARWAGLLLALGLLTKYSVGVIWLVIAFWLWWCRVRWQQALWILVPGPLAVALWGGISYAAYGVVHPAMVLLGVPGQVGAQRPGFVNLVDSAIFLAGAIPAFLPWFLLRGPRQVLVLLAAIPLALVLFLLRRPELNVVGSMRDLSRENIVWWFMLATTAMCLILTTLLQGIRVLRGSEKRERFVPVVWFWVGLVLGSAAAPFVAMRRVLDAALMGTIVAAASPTADRPWARRWVYGFVWPLALVVNGLIGYAAAISDYELAAVYPKYANSIARDQVRFTNKAWCYGYWGWMFYAERNGLKRYVPGREQPADGDMFVWLDVVAKPAVIPKDLRDRLQQLFKEYEHGSAPLRMMSKQAGAGYYSNVWGPLPYAWSQVPVEVLNAAVVTERSTDQP